MINVVLLLREFKELQIIISLDSYMKFKINPQREEKNNLDYTRAEWAKTELDLQSNSRLNQESGVDALAGKAENMDLETYGTAGGFGHQHKPEKFA